MRKRKFAVQEREKKGEGEGIYGMHSKHYSTSSTAFIFFLLRNDRWNLPPFEKKKKDYRETDYQPGTKGEQIILLLTKEKIRLSEQNQLYVWVNRTN